MMDQMMGGGMMRGMGLIGLLVIIVLLLGAAALQLTQLVDAAPEGDGWLLEIKYDGYRMHARPDRGRVKLLTRTGLDSHGVLKSRELDRHFSCFRSEV
jgi:bifunctional non-homologous end joining protein LigD